MHGQACVPYVLGFVNIQIFIISLLLSVPQTWSFLHRPGLFLHFGHVNYQFLNPWPVSVMAHVSKWLSLPIWVRKNWLAFLSGSCVAIGQLKSICFVDRQPWLPVPAPALTGYRPEAKCLTLFLIHQVGTIMPTLQYDGGDYMKTCK